MAVEGDCSSSEIIAAVEKAGYGAALKDAVSAAKKNSVQDADALADKETPKLKKRLWASVVPFFWGNDGLCSTRWPRVWWVCLSSRLPLICCAMVLAT
jgi:Cu2+-exporting ATPase